MKVTDNNTRNQLQIPIFPEARETELKMAKRYAQGKKKTLVNYVGSVKFLGPYYDMRFKPKKAVEAWYSTSVRILFSCSLFVPVSV